MAKKNKKKLWIVIGAVAAAAAIVTGVLLTTKKAKPVAVFSWDIVGFTDFYMSGGSSSGLVTTDKVQSIFVSETQKITKILVQEGQHVKEGDVLITYDTTLSDLALERKDLEIQQKEMSLKNAETELEKLYNMQPMVVTPPPETQPDPNKVDHKQSPADAQKYLNAVYDGDGRGPLTPYYFWLGQQTQIDDGMIGYLMQQAGDPDILYVVFQMTPEDKPSTPFDNQYGLKFTKVKAAPEPDPTQPSIPMDPLPTDPVESTAPTNPVETTASTDPSAAPTESTGQTETTAPEQTTQPPTEQPVARMDVKTGYAMSFFVPGQEDVEQGPEIDWNSGYTEAELHSLRKEKEAQIKELEVAIKTGKAELNIMKKEASAGDVRAKFDGTVSSVLEPENAISSHSPVVKVNGGGGFYVEGTVGELDLNTIQVGQKVKVNSWENGQTYEGEIVQIGQYPSDEQNHYSMDEPNQTYYPYRVFIDESADLMEGSYVELSYKAQVSEGGMMTVQNAFIRTDGNQSYVYVRNEQGVLEKRQVQAGVSRDGFYTPIYGGITEQDMLAFPYGKDVKEGAPTFEGSDQDLFGN